jgi:hypothetical protein
VKIRTIKTIVNNNILNNIRQNDIDTIIRFGDNYVMGEISSLCNIAGDPRTQLARIAAISSIAYTAHSLKGDSDVSPG